MDISAKEFLSAIQKDGDYVEVHPHFKLKVTKQEITLYWTLGTWVAVQHLYYRKNEWKDDNETLAYLQKYAAEMELAFLFSAFMYWVLTPNNYSTSIKDQMELICKNESDIKWN